MPDVRAIYNDKTTARMIHHAVGRGLVEATEVGVMLTT